MWEAGSESSLGKNWRLAPVFSVVELSVLEYRRDELALGFTEGVTVSSSLQ